MTQVGTTFPGEPYLTTNKQNTPTLLLLIMLVSAVAIPAITTLWLKWPSSISIVVVIVIELVGGFAFLISGLFLLFKIIRRPAASQHLAQLNFKALPKRATLSLLIALVLGNGVVFYLCDFQFRLDYLAATTLAIVVAWAAGRQTALKWMERKRHDLP